MSPDPDEQFTFHYEILHGFRASSSTHSGHFGGDFSSLGDAGSGGGGDRYRGEKKKQPLGDVENLAFRFSALGLVLEFRTKHILAKADGKKVCLLDVGSWLTCCLCIPWL